MNKPSGGMSEKETRRTGPLRARGMLISGAAVLAAILIFGLTTFQVFASPKSLMLNGVNATTNASSEATEESLHVTLSNLFDSSITPEQKHLLDSLNGASIDMSVVLDPASEFAQLDVDTTLNKQLHKGQLWLSKDKAVAEFHDYQDLFSNNTSAKVQIPTYLVTDASDSSALQSFWKALTSSATDESQTQREGTKNLETLFISAIPSKYFHRDGLTGVSIQFDQAGFQDILHSEVHAIYTNKVQFANDMAMAMTSKTQASIGLSPQDLKQSILDSLNQMPESLVRDQIDAIFSMNYITIEPTTVEVSRGILNSGLTEKISGGFSYKDGPQPSLSFAVDFNGSSSQAKVSNEQLPDVPASQSQSFSKFFDEVSQNE